MFEMGRLMKQEMQKDKSLPSYLHLEALRYINEAKEPSMRDIASFLRIAPPSATEVVNSFIAAGAVKRVHDAKDRRRVLLALCPKGKRILTSATGARERVFARILASLSKSDRAELARILAVITRTP
jgi:DNA-binding MarR family transcriptional regulator